MSTLNMILLIIFIVLFVVACIKDKILGCPSFSVLGIYILFVFVIWNIHYWIKYVTL